MLIQLFPTDNFQCFLGSETVKPVDCEPFFATLHFHRELRGCPLLEQIQFFSFFFRTGESASLAWVSSTSNPRQEPYFRPSHLGKSFDGEQAERHLFRDRRKDGTDGKMGKQGKTDLSYPMGQPMHPGSPPLSLFLNALHTLSALNLQPW